MKLNASALCACLFLLLSPVRAAGSDPADDFAGLPLSQAIRTQVGAGTRAVVVFEDPYCPYCRALHQTLGQSDDVVVFTFLLDVLDPDSRAKADRIWCSPDRAGALARWFGAHEASTAVAGCSAPVASLRALADRLHVQATPTLLFADGSMHAGAISASALEQRLRAAQVKRRTQLIGPVGAHDR